MPGSASWLRTDGNVSMERPDPYSPTAAPAGRRLSLAP